MVKKRSRGSSAPVLLIGTAKGGFLLSSKGGRKGWELTGPFHLGSQVHDFRLDPRDGRTLLLCSTGGHLGPTIFRSSDRGKTWKEAKKPPQFEKVRSSKRSSARAAKNGRSVKMNFWLTPGHVSEKGVWYCGTCPQGLFRSEDSGSTWKGVAGFNEGPNYAKWTFDGKNETPAGALLHSILIDPRDRKHMLLSLSVGGTFESFDQGRKWTPLNQGVEADFLPMKEPEFGQDPHCVILHPADPDRLYQQNHCGIYRLDRGETKRWQRIGRAMPKSIGDIGFPIVGHPRDPDVVWVFPMDGTKIWPRTSPEGKPAVYRTQNGGKSWERLDRGLPKKDAWFTVFRQAMDGDGDARATELYFGTTSGEVWSSRDEGESWNRIGEHLPKIYSLRIARFR